ncbi:MAG: peptide chain release factor 3, partial [Clostridiales bacterium]|nr:peptide chain release factor 3 [Clostridiales bacterium]
PDIGFEVFTIGVAGVLQFEVLEYRLKNEYNVELRLRSLPYTLARWVIADSFTKENIGYYDAVLVEDQYSRPVILANNEWTLGYILEKNKNIEFLDIAPVVEE